MRKLIMLHTNCHILPVSLIYLKIYIKLFILERREYIKATYFINSETPTGYISKMGLFGTHNKLLASVLY